MLLAFAALIALQHGQLPHWEYQGTHGPEYWGTLDKAYSACVSGKQQSPINISRVKPAPLPALAFDYKRSPLRIIDNGHTIQVNYAPGSFFTFGDQRYELQQFHFHHPAEERVDGKAYPMVAHLVHKNAAGKIAVVAVLLSQGNASAFLERLWSYVPKEKGQEVSPQGVSIDLNELLPPTRGYFTFAGSLTTPPCSEGVTWFVLKQPVPASKEAIEVFAEKYPHNARPLQPMNGRVILETQ